MHRIVDLPSNVWLAQQRCHRRWEMGNVRQLFPSATMALTSRKRSGEDKNKTFKKVMLSVWWGMRGVIHWELLPTGRTITADVYYKQLNHVTKALKEKQDKIYFLHDNARPHIANKTKKKILALKWTVLIHPPYSPDLDPSDYHLFSSLSHHLKEKRFKDEAELKEFLETFFKSQLATF